MRDLLLSPPIAFLIYVAIAGLLVLAGRGLAGAAKASKAKRSTYAGGEEATEQVATPGYRQFFVIALFFAILHLGALVLGSGGQTLTTLIYLVGLCIALVALILG